MVGGREDSREEQGRTISTFEAPLPGDVVVRHI